MSFNALKYATTKRAIGFTHASNSALLVGDPIPWASPYAGTSGHGITVAAGVVTLPAGYAYLCMIQATTTGGTEYRAYIDGVLDASAQYVSIAGAGVTMETSNNNASVIVKKSDSSQTIEFRSTAARTVLYYFSHLTILQIG